MKNRLHEAQIISSNGRPAFAVIPYDVYLLLLSEQENSKTYIPHEVAEIMLLEEVSYVTAWRKYRKISQKELADRIGVTQASISQMEKNTTKLQTKTLEKIAKALDVSVEQLTDE